MFCMRDISHRLINMLSVYAQSVMHRPFYLMKYCGFNIEPFCSDVCGDHRRLHALAEICRNMGICCGFRAVATRKKYPGFTLLIGSTQKKAWVTNFILYHHGYAMETHKMWRMAQVYEAQD